MERKARQPDAWAIVRWTRNTDNEPCSKVSFLAQDPTPNLIIDWNSIKHIDTIKKEDLADFDLRWHFAVKWNIISPEEERFTAAEFIALRPTCLGLAVWNMNLHNGQIK